MLESLLAGRSGLTPCDFETADLRTYIGEVPGVDEVRLPAELAPFNCRNNRLAELGLRQDGFADAVARVAGRYTAARVGVFIGTSTAGILETEQAYRRRDPVTGALPADFEYAKTQNSFSVADYVRRRLQLRGPAAVVSCACASSAKVFASAQRMIEVGLIDAAVVGGVDSLCLTTLYGFHSLQLSSAAPCRPFDVARDGISVGEAAAFVLLERPDRERPGRGRPGCARSALDLAADDVVLLGVGESSDAYHMSAPHPEGLGARHAMQAALTAAHLPVDAVDYINFHGTGTLSNDRSESRAVVGLFGTSTPGSSTKGATGHTLGAAGALEAVICALALRHEFMPGGLNISRHDPALSACYLRETRRVRLGAVLSNSFGFGGTNCSLLLGRAG